MTNNKLNDDELLGVSGGFGAADVVASGSFASNSGTSLNLLVNWSVVNDNYGQRTLQVAVSAVSYALVTISLYNGVQMTLNGIVYSATSNAIDYRGKSKVSNPLASFSVPYYQGPSPISVVFHFNGTLSGQPVSDIVAAGTITA